MAKDRISTLPDEILCRILYFLAETKHVVATSILSKRWNHLWLSVPTLFFTPDIPNQDTQLLFCDFVNSVLLSRDAALPVTDFHLEIFYDSPLECSIKDITRWINFAIQRRVQDIYLCLYIDTGGLPKLPVKILSSRTLVVLEISGFCVEKSYSSILLPCLKNLYLGLIWFPKLRDFLLFLSGCPILEELVTRELSFDSEESLTSDEWKSFCLSKMKEADIDFAYCHLPLKVVHNIQFLSFSINEVLYRNDLIPTFHNLTRLEYMGGGDYSWQFLLQVLNHCPKLQKLTFYEAKVDDETWIRNFDKEDWVDPYVVPRCISLHLRTCYYRFSDLPGELIIARYILKNARVLQTMTIRNKTKLDLERILSSYPWASSMCKLTID